MIKNVKRVELNTKIATAFWNTHNLIEYRRLCCNKNSQKRFDGNLKKRFTYTYKFSNHDINKFVLWLWKGVFPYEYLDDWEKFNEMSLLEKEDFHSHLNMENITNADYTYKKVKILI